MTVSDNDLELWAAFAAKPHAQPAGACTLAELVAEVRRLREAVLAEREACAAAALDATSGEGTDDPHTALRWAADAIRARPTP